MFLENMRKYKGCPKKLYPILRLNSGAVHFSMTIKLVFLYSRDMCLLLCFNKLMRTGYFAKSVFLETYTLCNFMV